MTERATPRQADSMVQETVAGARDNRHYRTPLLCSLILALFVLALPVDICAEDTPDAVVLVLNSYHYGYSWSDNEMTGTVETFRTSPLHYELRTEYLDTKFFPNKELDISQKAQMAVKYRGINIPVVIAADNPALDFALAHRDQLFPRAAIVFCGINGYGPSRIAGHKRVTGVAERLDTTTTVATALALHPDTREIFVVHDYTTTGLATRHEAETDLAPFANRVRIHYMDNLNTDDMLRQVKGLRKGTIVLALSYSRDKDGIVYDHPRIARLLGENSPVPVYGAHEERIGHGIVGGSLVGGYLQGSTAATIALRILHGEDVGRIPIQTKSPARLSFDYRQMTRFGISPSQLPEGAIIVNAPESFYHKYRRLVLTTAGAMAGLLLIILLLAINITQRRRSEQAIAQKAAELEQSNQELQEFNVLAYHNLQEPLRTIGGFVQLLERKYHGSLDEQANEYIGFVVEGVSRMKQLFNDFLAYSRLSRNGSDEEDVDLTLVLDTVREKLHQALAANEALIVSEPLPHVLGNAQQLTLLLQQLIDNALKFRRDVTPMIRLESTTEGDFHRISVSDNGIGIEPAYHENIFRMFTRLNPQDRYPGTGIGLALSRKIVLLHGGRIGVESTPGEGTTFHFTLKRVKIAATSK